MMISFLIMCIGARQYAFVLTSDVISVKPSLVGPQDVTRPWLPLPAILSTITVMARWQVLKTVVKHHVSKEIPD